jgi:hypothetical protein
MVVRHYAPTQAQRLKDEDQEPLDPREFYEAKIAPEQLAEAKRRMDRTAALFYTENGKLPTERTLDERLASFKKKKKSPKITIS